jgi:hypothetical protein
MALTNDAGWDLREAVTGELAELSPESVAGECRRAYMEIVSGVRGSPPRWHKPELARWLTGSYSRLAQEDVTASGPVSVVSGPVSIADDRLGRVLEVLRIDILLVMNELTSTHGLSAFVKLAFDTRLIGRDRDTGAIVPLARSRMSLVDRVMSLVAVDAVIHPQDFEDSLFVCERCHQPVFDAVSRPYNVCRVHVSGVTTSLPAR